jgi:hypothetical protein
MGFEIVVAHYNENLDWLKNFPPKQIHVYSKGNPATIPCVATYTAKYRKRSAYVFKLYY